MVKWTFAVFLAALLAPGCARDINNNEAVRKGVVDYLNKRKGQTGLDMTLMNVAVSNVTFQNNEASAMVSFQPKAGGTQGMSMNYVLERKGSEWVVKGRKESGVNPHGAQGTPEAMPADPSGALPAGHPPTSTPPSDKK
jgi:hypothetical protein